MCHDSARYWKDSDKQCQPNPCSCGGYLQEEPNNNNKTAKKSWQLLEKEMNQLVFMWLKDMGPNFKHDFQVFCFLLDHNYYEADRQFHAYLWQLGELT